MISIKIIEIINNIQSELNIKKRLLKNAVT